MTTRFAPAALLLIATLAPAQELRFRVRETAGLRRFSFPVRASAPGQAIRLPAQLLENGKPVPAQFTPLPGGRTDIDFNVSLGPGETREFLVQPGPGATATDKGVSVNLVDRKFAVRHGVEFDIPENLSDFITEVRGSKLSYLRPGSKGLLLNYRDDAEFRPAAPTKAQITKKGPLVAGLRFEGTQTVVEMDFPRSKSWVEVRWTVQDPERRIAGMMADVNLLLEGPPALVDFGANSTVYVALKPGQDIALEAAAPSAGPPSWFVNLSGQPYASGVRTRAEGWAHAMDQLRATAIAVAGFGEQTRDRIQISDTGRLRIRRDCQGGGERSLRFWLHFVTMPVQVGAATSPQAMMSPLRIEWE
jgi:hypothetical protein